MLGFFERRNFLGGEKIWLGRYENLTNVLHWHFECELIRIVAGSAKIKIGDCCFEATAGDCFFCASETLHYIISPPATQIDVAIFDKDLLAEITGQYTVASPKLPGTLPIEEHFEAIRSAMAAKALFYNVAIENLARSLLINIFQNCPIVKYEKKPSLHKTLIAKINREFAFITFEDAVRHCGYSPAHFSKTFKKLTGMSFTEYLNIIKVEHAIELLHHNSATVTAISQKCGFSTIRNFNRVFKKVTGYSPLSLPKDFIIDTGLHILGSDHFDPTDQRSILI